jgi:tetratricopeptide (TPR) repeat protein
MLAQQGDFDRAIKALDAAAAKGGGDPSTQLLLAQIYARQGRLRDAEAVYDKLLAPDPPPIEAIQEAADLLASSGRFDEAAKVLGRVNEAHPSPGMAELLTAQFNERWGSADTARRAYLAATAAAPKDPSVWRQLIAFHLRHGAFDLAKQSADDAGKTVPDDASIKRMRSMSSELAQLSAANPPLAKVFTVLAGSPEDRGVIAFLTGGSTPAASAASDATSPATSQPSSADAGLAKLKELAPRHPRSLALQAALVQCFAVMHQLPDAVATAERAAEAFPTDTDLPRIASELQRELGKLDRAAADARLWLARSADNPRPARLAVAEIEVARGNAKGAIDVLAPVTPQLIEYPRRDIAASSALLRAYAAAGRADEAQKILQPLLPSDRVWRMLWLQIASLDLRDTALGAKWIGIAEPMIGEEVERIAMADAWCHLAARTSGKETTAAYEAAAKVLDGIVARQDAPADAIIVRGMVCERAGDIKGAEELYRRALRLQPKRPETLNNLAYLILEQHENGAAVNLSEAKAMADQAVRLAPTNASFLDTLARIQFRGGDRDAAIASFQRALSLDPQSLDAMLGLATAMMDAGQRNAAANLLPQIELALKTRPNLSPQLRKELDALRATTKASL